MDILKGFMILGAICYMFIAFAEQTNEKYFIRDMLGMLGCGFLAMAIHFLQSLC